MASSYNIGRFFKDLNYAFNSAAVYIQDISNRFNTASSMGTDAKAMAKKYAGSFNTIINDPNKGKVKKGIDIFTETVKTFGDIDNLLNKYMPVLSKPFPKIPQRPYSSPAAGTSPGASKPSPPKKNMKFTNSAEQAKPKPYATSQEEKPTKEDLAAKVKEFCESMRPYGKFTMEFDFQDYGIKTRINHEAEEVAAYQSAAKSGLEEKLAAEDFAPQKAKPSDDPGYDHFVKSAGFVGNLYNNGKNYREIKHFALGQGIALKSYDEMLGLVAANIANGGEYRRYNYNRNIASHLSVDGKSLNDFVVQAKLSGMTNAQIREVVNEKASGMNISKSTIIRMVKQYRKNQADAKK